MKKAIQFITSGVLLFGGLLFPGLQLAYCGYDDVQQTSTRKSTSTVSNDWYWRGNHHLVKDTDTVRCDQLDQYLHLYASGTVNAVLFEGSGAGITGIPAPSISAGALGPSVIASSFAVNSIPPEALRQDTTFWILVASAIWAMNGGSGGGGAVYPATETFSLRGGDGEVYIGSGTYLCQPDAWKLVSFSSWTITRVYAYCLQTSTVSATTFNIGLSTTTDNTGVFGNLLETDLSVPADNKYSEEVALDITVPPHQVLFLQVTGIPASGTLPAAYGIEVSFYRNRP